MESKLQYDLITSNMQNVASKVSSSIIYAHMANLTIDTTKLADFIKYEYALYDKEHAKLIGNLLLSKGKKIDLSKKLQKVDDSYVLVESSPKGHLGVYHIVIKENIYHGRIEDLLEKLYFYFFLTFSTITVIAYYLAGMFIAPIINERKKLNNFIKDTTHELNTPITAILMSTGKGAPATEKNLQRINLSAKRISEIYKDLVYLFLQDNKKPKKLTKLNLDEIILEQLEYFDSFASKKRLRITSNLEPTKFTIDKENFIRLFNNLVSNAIKYNIVGGSIDIELKNSILKIKDTGIGIAEEKLEDIFNRYYRATKEQGGFGIGLNIVYHICKSYNIKIDVQSKEKEGTTFTLDFKG